MSRLNTVPEEEEERTRRRRKGAFWEIDPEQSPCVYRIFGRVQFGLCTGGYVQTRKPELWILALAAGSLPIQMQNDQQ
jgi:hypothetical protein